MRTPFAVFFCFALIGIGVDFMFNGILKVVWLAIYGPVYLGIASTLYNSLYKTSFRASAKLGAFAFLGGAAAGHCLWTGHTETRIYPMSRGGMSGSTITLRSPRFSRTLVVTSELLRKTLPEGLEETRASSSSSGNSSGNGIPVAIQVVQDYGCIRTFKVSTVAGVDVMNDPGSLWVWRSDEATSASSPGPGAPLNGPLLDGIDEENQRKPWCMIHWY